MTERMESEYDMITNENSFPKESLNLFNYIKTEEAPGIFLNKLPVFHVRI